MNKKRLSPSNYAHVVWLENMGGGFLRPQLDSVKPFRSIYEAQMYVREQAIEDLYDTFGRIPLTAGLPYRNWDDVPFNVLMAAYVSLRFPLGIFDIF